MTYQEVIDPKWISETCSATSRTSVVFTFTLKSRVYPIHTASLMAPKGARDPPGFADLTQPSDPTNAPQKQLRVAGGADRKGRLPVREKNGRGPGEDDLPLSAFAEPSEPSELAPEDNPKEQLTHNQEENPQVVLRKPSKQNLKL